MKIRFQADADLHSGVGLGLLRRERQIDWRPARGIIPDATPDPEVLLIAAEAGRVLVSRDIGTMPGHFAEFIATNHSSGVILVPSTTLISATIERLLLVWRYRSAEEFENQIWWLSF